jgi:hypothetical protein
VVLAGIGLLVLHNDDVLLAWMGHDHWWPGPIGGWLPFDVAYHLAWVVAGVLFMHIVLRMTWRHTP